MRVTPFPLTRALADSLYAPNGLVSGEEVFPRSIAASTTIAMTSQLLRLTFFTARKTESISQVRYTTGGTAAGATPTVVRFAVYSVAANGDLTLVASTPNDTALLAGTFARAAKSFSVAFTKTQGQRYAVGLLVVTGATAPTMSGISSTAELDIAPRLTGQVAAQSDLPSSVAAASVAATSSGMYAAVVP